MTNEQQKDEVIALESIYNAEEFSHSEVDGQFHCVLKAFVQLPDNYYLIYKDLRKQNDAEEKITIAHLSPITLYVTLPPDYPQKSPPEFTFCCSWLPYKSLLKICRKLDELWADNKGQEILFTWIAFLQNDLLEFSKFTGFLNISRLYTRYREMLEAPKDPLQKIECDTSNSDNKNVKSKIEFNKKKYENKGSKKLSRKNRWNRIVNDQSTKNNPVQVLLDYSEKRTIIEFKKQFYTCKICFMDKSGESCSQFKPCMHVFCKDCITGYLEVKINDGDVQNICCPEEKCHSEALPGQIKDLVSPELFAKYDATLLSATLDTMLDIVYCPRRHCQYPVSKEPNENMASCPACNYVFCIYCKMVYHGVEPCRVIFEEKQKLVNDYLNASNEQKQKLESRYGQKQLKVLVENTMSENWILNNSQNCPNCRAAIEKSDGCNKMTCNKCSCYFCWICGTRLNKEMPYFHFQNPKSKCYNKLYQGVIEIEDDDEDDIDYPAIYLGHDSDDDDFFDEDFDYD